MVFATVNLLMRWIGKAQVVAATQSRAATVTFLAAVILCLRDKP
jgi:hypothetical protein